MQDKPVVVIYHKKCPDGFGAAYAAWKKFGDTAAYVPAGYGGTLPEGLEGKEVYILDFSFDHEDEMDQLLKIAKRVVAIDHHESGRPFTEQAPEHIYDPERSGATLAWAYFHPRTPMPQLMQYLEDGDTYRYAMPETEAIFSYLVVQPDDFTVWDTIVRALEDDDKRPALLAKASAYHEYFERMGHLLVESAKRVRFEGYVCYFSASFPSITLRSHIAHELYTTLPPIALVVSAHPDGFGVSIRGDGSVNVAKIAEKYGGGGHPDSAGFFIPASGTIPWKEVTEEE